MDTVTNALFYQISDGWCYQGQLHLPRLRLLERVQDRGGRLHLARVREQASQGKGDRNLHAFLFNTGGLSIWIVSSMYLNLFAAELL